MVFHILTLFPDMVCQGLSASIIDRARKRGLIGVNAVNIRDFSTDRHRKVDDYTYGGGAGMLMQPQPVYDAWKSVAKDKRPRTVYVTPQGRPFTQELAGELAQEDELVILCGHYEGIDERVLEEVVTDYVSIGDYVLTGGELAAMVMVDAVSRLVPGVLHNGESSETESFHGKLLEYPQYSRPEVWHGRRVPQVLLSGDAKKISQWRREQSEIRTRERRADLFREYGRLMECRKLMMRQKLLHMDMIQLITRGQARLLYHQGGQILLQDMKTGIFFHTDMDGGASVSDIARILADGRRKKDRDFSLVFHQRAAFEALSAPLGLVETAACNQAVWTPKEMLPVRGLYRPDGKPMEKGSTRGLYIRQMDTAYLAMVCEHADRFHEESYYRRRLESGAMFGAFFGQEPGGFIGEHPEGSIGMLYVFPKYRRAHVAMALETFMMNRCIEQGYTPFGQVVAGNAVSGELQRKLKVFLSADPVIWAEPANL